MKKMRLEIVILGIGLAAFFGFSPLFEVLGDGIALNALAAGFSAIFVVLATKILLGHETDISQKQRQSERIFERRSTMYQDTLEHLITMLDSEQIQQQDLRQFRRDLIKLESIAPDNILTCYYEIFENVLSIIEKDAPDESGQQNSNEDLLAQIAGDEASSLAIRIRDYARLVRQNLGLDDSKTNDEKFNNFSNQIHKRSQSQIIESSKGRAELSGGIEEWLRSGGNNNQESLDALSTLHRIRKIAESMTVPLRVKATKTQITLRNEASSGRRKVALYINRVSQTAIRMSIPLHVSDHSISRIREILTATNFEFFELGDGSTAFNFPIPITETSEKTLRDILNLSADGTQT